jgi:hypothetical protein
MKTGAAIVLAFVSCLSLAHCTGGQEGSAAEEPAPRATAATTPAETTPLVNPRKELRDIHPAIPVYAGAQFREDLSRRDAVMVRNQYGPQAAVYTLATDDSFPQVYHYYSTYLAQFRAFPAQSPYPSETQNWRTLEIPLNQVMQDPFIPGDTISPSAKHVLLQVAETEAEPKTVIRYIITPGEPAGVAVASSQ